MPFNLKDIVDVNANGYIKRAMVSRLLDNNRYELTDLTDGLSQYNASPESMRLVKPFNK